MLGLIVIALMLIGLVSFTLAYFIEEYSNKRKLTVYFIILAFMCNIALMIITILTW